MGHRGELTDQQWERLKPLLPAEKPGTGRPNADHRRIIDGILWRDLPERYGPWSTVYSRFWRWREAGIWDRIFAAVQQRADEAGGWTGASNFVDGSVIRAHQHAAGARGGSRSRGAGAQPGRLLDQGAPLHTDGVLFSGDTLFQGSIGKFDGNGGSFEQIMSRLMPLPEETIVRPGHMDQTTNGFERRNNPFVQQILEAMRSR
jgi:transposase